MSKVNIVCTLWQVCRQCVKQQPLAQVYHVAQIKAYNKINFLLSILNTTLLYTVKLNFKHKSTLAMFN